MGNNFSSSSICCKRSIVEPEMKQKDYLKYFKKYISKILLIQSIWRGFLKRNMITKSKSTMMLNRKYSVMENFTPNLNWRVKNIINSLPPFNNTNEYNNKILKKIGPVIYDNNIIYKGQVDESLEKEGFGELFLPDGSKYEGYFKAGLMNGLGRLINIQGDFYEGEFKNDKANGQGKYISNEGVIYIGSWKDDKQHGKGDETFPDKSKYIGNFENGDKNGKGKFFWPDGSLYEGNLDHNTIEGRGLYKWKDGRIFYGDWKNNKMEGIGVFLWPDDKKFVGMYKQDKKDGFGIFYWTDGRIYEGFWKHGKQHGYGLMKIKNVIKYGEWESGTKLKWFERDIHNIQITIDNMKKILQLDSLLNSIPDQNF